MSKFCYYDHSMAASHILDAARYFINKPFPAESDLRMCESLLHAYRLVNARKEELAEQFPPPVTEEDTTEADMAEAFGA